MTAVYIRLRVKVEGVDLVTKREAGKDRGEEKVNVLVFMGE